MSHILFARAGQEIQEEGIKQEREYQQKTFGSHLGGCLPHLV